MSARYEGKGWLEQTEFDRTNVINSIGLGNFLFSYMMTGTPGAFYVQLGGELRSECLGQAPILVATLVAMVRKRLLFVSTIKVVTSTRRPCA